MRDDSLVLGDRRSEIRLDLLLDEMLGIRAAEGGWATIGAPSPIPELRDAARRLRAASQWFPLPESRQTVRRALLIVTHQSQGPARIRRAAWRRAGMWLSALAMIAIVGAWSLGTGPTAPASSTAHALRVLLEKAWPAWSPGPARYALTYEFPPVRLVDRAGRAKIHGTVGGLPVVLSITTTAGACGSGTPCGTFTISPAQLSSAAGARFGTMRGALGCAADGGCTLAFAEMTGVFAAISDPALSISATGERVGRFGTKLAAHEEWVSTVTSAAQRLQAGGLLPAGITVENLATAAGTNGTSHRNDGGGPSGSRKPDVQHGAIQPGTGTGSTTPNGVGLVGPGSSHSAPALQDHVSQRSRSGAGAGRKDRGVNHSVGGPEAPSSGLGSGSGNGRGAGSRRDRDQRGGDDGTRGDGRGPSGRTESSGSGHGVRGDDGSTQEDRLQGGDHQTTGGGEDRGPARSGSGDRGSSKNEATGGQEEQNHKRGNGGPTSSGGHHAAGGSPDSPGGGPARGGGDKGAGGARDGGAGGDKGGDAGSGGGGDKGGGDRGGGDKGGSGGDRGK